MARTPPDTLPEAASRTGGAGVSLFDARPFFEKALQYGLQHGLIDSAKLDAIAADAPKGMVQIARYFGNEFLRPDLEKARERLVNLVSLYLEHSSGGDLVEAAQSLQVNSFLSRSKGGSDLLKALLAMPQNSHFGMTDDAGLAGRFQDDQIPLLAKWSLRPLADYTLELAKRRQVAGVLDAAIWAAEQGGMDVSDLQDAGKDAEAVIRSYLLVQATGRQRQRLPDWVGFEKMVGALRKKAVNSPLVIAMPGSLPQALAGAIASVRLSVLADLPRILDADVPVRQLFERSPAFIGRYFWVEDMLHDVAEFDAQTTKAWDKATGGQTEESALLTMFLCIAAGSAPKTLLTEKNAASLIRKIRKTGFHPALARDYIGAHAPVQYESDYARLWAGFTEEAQGLLTSDAAFALEDALALLRRECQVQ